MNFEELKSIVEKQENDFRFSSFSHLDAWNLGYYMVEEIYNTSLPLAVCIRDVKDDAILFQHLTETTSSLHEMYMLKKYHTVLKTKHSSYLEFIKMNISRELIDEELFDKSKYMIKGGAFPVKDFNNQLLAVICVSNLDHPDDHQFIINCLNKLFKNAAD